MKLSRQSFRSQPQAHSRRAGVSLGELLIVISLSTVLMMIAGAMIQELLRADRAVRRTAETSAKLLRLESLFRDDVQRAMTVSVHADDAGDSIVELAVPEGQKVTYAVHQHILQRAVTAGETRLHFDRFAFPEESVIALTEIDGRAIELEIDVSRRSTRGATLPRFYSPQTHRIVARPAFFLRPGGQP